ncbi:MAG: hypothetical protein B7Y85_10310 [Brevundimonas sp. 32-68-21]|nr:MAG: hypothetical protein B7Y85_10310 [Brevundimonas sp. 32-68-21]
MEGRARGSARRRRRLAADETGARGKGGRDLRLGRRRRRGVVAESEAKVRDERPAGDRILALVEQTGANLIVAGAWGHSRMREWVLGGVTQALLNRSQSWLLLSH